VGKNAREQYASKGNVIQSFLKTAQVPIRTASKSCFCGVSKSAFYEALHSNNCTKQLFSINCIKNPALPSLVTNFFHKMYVPFCVQQEKPHIEPCQNPCLANSLHTIHNARAIRLWLTIFKVIFWFLHHHQASPVQVNAVETDIVTCQQLILFYWSRTPWYNMDRVWFDKLAANTELVNTCNIFHLCL